MKETDWRNTLEVIVKGLVAVVVGLAGLYLLGWLLSLLGGLLLGFASIIVALLRWLVPVAILVGIVYFIVTQLQSRTVNASRQVKTTTVSPEPEFQEKIVELEKLEAVDLENPQAVVELEKPVDLDKPKAVTTDSSKEDQST